EVARGEISGLAVQRAAFIHDFERRQDPALLDIVEFDRFIWELDWNRRHCLPSNSLVKCAMNISDRLVGSPSRESIELFRETRLVRITHGGFAIWLDPFGMLDAQVVVNLLPEFGVRVNLVRHNHCLGATNEFHKPPFIWVDCSKSARNEEPSSRGAFNSGLASGDSGLQLNLEIALSGASAKVKLPNRF